jgi:hypothetical protein
VTAQVDRSKLVTFRAAAQDGWVLWQYEQYELNEPTLNLLSFGRTLYVTIGTETYQYDLVRSEAMLKELLRCAIERMPASNPFAAAPPAANPFAETASNPYRRM